MRTILYWIAMLIVCSTVLTSEDLAQENLPAVPPCVKVDGCPPANEWYTYRYSNSRTGAQPFASGLSGPNEASRLSVKWSFPATGAVGAFKASPIVVGDTVFIGSTNGRFYALDAATGALRWQYPPTSQRPLLGSCDWGQNANGIQSSATHAIIGGQTVVIFGAPDPSIPPFPQSDPNTGLGSARLFALQAFPPVGTEPALIWKSNLPVAQVGGCPPGDSSQLHERIAYSSPLVLDNKVYIGVHDAGDNPIQQGRISVVDLSSGALQPFSYASTGTLRDGTRGGGVWNALATEGAGVYFTTGNTRIPPCFYPYRCPPPAEPEPSPNHGLSLVRVDKANGNIVWSFQPVPYNLDGDPDWAAGAAVLSTACGELIASVQKDGWSYAVNASSGAVQWQFPPTQWNPATMSWNFPFTDYVHGDDGYRQPGATWNDVFIVRTGGESLAADTVTAGYGKLHALDACATTEQGRVRWIADIPNNSGMENSLGAPTVTGGVVFIGTDLGHLVVLGDPSIVFAAGQRCSNIDYLTPSDCTRAGYTVVPVPKVLVDVTMPDGGDIAYLRKEPALARGRVFVATSNGHVYMLDTAPPPAPTQQCLRCCADLFADCVNCVRGRDTFCPTPAECADGRRSCEAACNRGVNYCQQ